MIRNLATFMEDSSSRFSFLLIIIWLRIFLTTSSVPFRPLWSGDSPGGNRPLVGLCPVLHVTCDV